MASKAQRRRPLVSGNWKMHHDHLQSIRTVQDLGLRLTAADVGPLDVSIHPPFTDLRSVQTVLEDRSIPVALGAQHCFSEDQGAFTGEVAPPMLARLGVTYVIVGHSERRQLFGQTDEDVAATLRAVLQHGMTPIVCVGETADEREADETELRLTAQTTAALKGLPAAPTAGLVLAYEPIWAIGTGATATGEDAQKACALIRALVAELAGEEAAQAVRIQYGGSVRPENAAELVGQRDIDGLLVGGASLDGASFATIVRQAGTALR
jgi:triosephosphate isomerase (TIM)